MNKEEWEEIIERGAIILPSYELHRLAGPLYEADDEGQIDETKPVGHHPNTYWDKSYQDHHYYSVTALVPSKTEIGVFEYHVYDEDENCYNDDVTKTMEISDPYQYQTEKECWRLQGYSDEDFYRAMQVNAAPNGRMNRTLYHQAGNSIPVPIFESLFKEILKELDFDWELEETSA